jgi:hypothetical protein
MERPSEAVEAVPAAELRDVRILRALGERGRPAVESELRGASMGAAIPAGSRILIQPVGASPSLLPGRVVAFLAGSRVMVHRVVHVGASPAARGFVITQGDGNWLCDPPVALDHVAGAVDRYFAEGEWREVPAARPEFARRLVSAPALALMVRVLEWNPRAALALARGMSRMRMGTRSAWMNLQRLARHVRH